MVAAWKLRVRHYKPMAEAALDLMDAVKGEGQKEFDYVDLERDIFTENGVQYVIDAMKIFDQERMLRLGDVLGDYEHLRRTPGELIDKYHRRFRECEAAMRDVGLTYHEGQMRG